MSELSVTVNGSPEPLTGVEPHTSLLWFLRQRGYVGAKEGCAEGECGACAVVWRRQTEDGARYEAVNSCLVLAAAMAGQEVVTAEGFAEGERLHPVQQVMVDEGGSQCGYCTPGFVASMFAEVYRPERDGYDAEAIAGNLCRCTGYRPIRDALRRLPLAPPTDDHLRKLDEPVAPMASIEHGENGHRFFRPSELDELYRLLREHAEAQLIAGGTDVVVEINQRHRRHDVLVSLEGIEALRAWSEDDHALTIGAGVPLSHVERRMADRLPILRELFHLFSSRLIRNRATLGGNLVNASPIGDSPPVLLALGAEVEIGGAGGTRRQPLDGFFTDYRQTILKPGEILTAVRIPKPFPQWARFYKVSKREMDDISTVAGAFAIDLDGATVKMARFAFGGVAATPVRAKAAEAAVVGQPWNEATVRAAAEAATETVSPIDDHRGSAAYRKAMVGRLLHKLHFDTTLPDPSATSHSQPTIGSAP